MITPLSVTARALLAFGLILGSAQFAAAQEATVTGIVTDESDRPIAGVQVTVVNTTIGGITREDGRYTLARVPEGVRVIEARRIGFQPGRRDNVNVPASGSVTVDFRLSVQTLRLQTVVTTGVTDPTEGVKLPVTVAKLTAADLPVPTTASAASAIMGKVAGVRIVRGTGPDAGTSIQLRTPTSQFKSTSPMFIVDGVILSQSFGGTTADIEALDIATIEVIKGAAAASLYGSKAANGVVSITTNRGANIPVGQTQFQVRQEAGINTIKEYLPKPQHHQFRQNAAGEYVDANNNVVGRNQRIVDRVTTRDATGIMDNQYKDPTYDNAAQFFKNGRFLSTNVSAQQNSASTNFATTYNFYREPGVVTHADGLTRNNFRVNLDHRLRDDIRFGVSAYHQRARVEPLSVSFSDFQRLAIDVNLLAPPLPGTGVPYLIIPDSTDRRTNPLYRQLLNDDLDTRARTLISGDFGYNPLSWLSFAANLSYDRSDRENSDFIAKGAYSTDGENRTDGDYSKFSGATDGLNGNVSVTALHAFGDLTTRTTVRGLLEKETNQTTTAETSDFTTSGVKELDAGTVPEVASAFSDVRALSGLVTTAVDYAGKYIGDVLVRYDGSSLFGPDNRWNRFYRLSGAYRMAEEPWWPVSDLNEFKLRYSIGTGGTRPDFLDQYETLLLETGGGVVRRALGNPELRPEIATEQELALETIYKNRISLQLSYIRNHSRDNIIGVSPPGGSGYNTQEVNTGAIKATTYEATIQAQLLSRQNLSWEMNLVADRSTSRVTEFNRPCYGDGLAIRCEGYVMSWQFGARFVNGVDELYGEAANRPEEFQYNDDGYLVWVGPGNHYTEGATQNLWGSTTTIDGVDYAWGRPILLRDSLRDIAQVRIGDANPDFGFGLGNTIRWKGFQIYGLLTGQIGGNIYNNARDDMLEVGDAAEIDQAGKPERFRKPMSYYVTGLGGSGTNAEFIESGTYAKLTELNVRYSVPTRALGWLAQRGVEGMTLEMNARNLFTLTNYSGYDPEVGGLLSRIDDTGQPRYRNFTGVVSLIF